jgi:hypothetical protein
MPKPGTSPIQVLFPQSEEAWSALAERLRETDGDILLVLAGRELELLAQPEVRKQFLVSCKKMQQRLRIATKHPAIAAEARAAGIRVLDRTKHIRTLLAGNPKLNEALRVFSPQLWRQQLKSQMQRMGLLSVPKLRIFSLVGLSGLLFFFVVFRLLPSAEIRVRPRQETISQTVNIFLVQSGATADIATGVRRVPLIPVTVDFKKSVTFDHISKEFIGTSAQTQMTVVNKAQETYELRAGTRFTNQAGMVFRILDHAIVEPGQELAVRAKADDVDLYGQIIGDRGNVPAGLKWEIPGLAVEERALVYGENRQAATGGKTAYRTILRNEDLELARKRLEQELLADAKSVAEERREEMNAENPKKFFVLLNYSELTSTTYSGFVLPTQFLGQEIASVPVEGSIRYTMFVYDADYILNTLRDELQTHVREGSRLLDQEIGREDLIAHVIAYDDNLSWVKLTVDLTARQEFVLDPLSPTGALFGKEVREKVTGLPQEEALRIIRNMTEVDRVEIRQWPPWNNRLPPIASHISIVPY